MLFFLIGSLIVAVLAQVQVEGKFRTSVARPNKAGSIRQTRIYTLPKQNNEVLLMQAESEQSSESVDGPIDDLLKPHKFAESIPMVVDIEKDGVWEINQEAGFRVLRATITSSQAKSLSLVFKDFYLPEHGELYVIGQDRILGAFVGSINNKPKGEFATVPLPGEVLLIEYYEPLGAGACEIPHEKLGRKGIQFGRSRLYSTPMRETIKKPEERVRLSLASVSHGFQPYMKSFGDSGSCNVDVACEKRAGVTLKKFIVIKFICISFREDRSIP